MKTAASPENAEHRIAAEGGESGTVRGAGPAANPPQDRIDLWLEELLRRLDEVESLALEQAALLEQGSSDRERALRERVTMLEAAQSRLQAEVKRREQDWEDLLNEVENDRRLLTEAWGRLEAEQLSPAATAPPPGQTAVAGRAPAPERTAAFAAPALQPDELVTRDILWQFQTLKHDVRRNASGAGGR